MFLKAFIQLVFGFPNVLFWRMLFSSIIYLDRLYGPNWLVYTATSHYLMSNKQLYSQARA